MNLGSKRPLYLRKKRATAIGIGEWSSKQLSLLGIRAPVQDPQEDPNAGIREERKWDIQRFAENKKMDIVER
jgi:hypothetical protein